MSPEEVYGALKSEIDNTNYVQAVADGVKTISQLVDSVYAQVDINKVNAKSCFMSIDASGETILQISYKSSNMMYFDLSSPMTNPPYMLTSQYQVRATGSSFRVGADTYQDLSNNVPASGTIYRLCY